VAGCGFVAAWGKFATGNQSSFGTAQTLHTVTAAGGSGLIYTTDYRDRSRELSRVTLPYGGTLEWADESRGRSMMHVAQRFLNTNDGTGTKVYYLSKDVRQREFTWREGAAAGELTN
jgi:hypothetical protein